MGFFDFIPIVGDVIKGFQGSKAANNAQDAQANQQAADREMQREFAQNGLRWQVEQARSLGLSPLSVLGNAPSYSPVAMGVQPDNSWGDAFSDMGQDISRAVNATRPAQERTDAMSKLAIRKAELENEFLQTQIASSKLAVVRQAGGTPPAPSMVRPQPHEPIYDVGGSEPSHIADVGFSRRDTSKGPIYYPMPGKDTADRLDVESGLFPNLTSIAHMWRNNVVPNMPHNWLNQDKAPPKSQLPAWADRWMWDMSEQGWRPIKG